MSRAIIHVVIDEDLLERIEKLVDKGELTKSEIVRRTLGYGIGEMEQAINRFTTVQQLSRYPISCPNGCDRGLIDNICQRCGCAGVALISQ